MSIKTMALPSRQVLFYQKVKLETRTRSFCVLLLYFFLIEYTQRISSSYAHRIMLISLSNYNYGQAGEAIGVDLLKKPALVATDATISFKTALWFWMTPQPPKPSCHAVITGNWTPSDTDRSAGRLPGYGLITNLIDGGVECGKGRNAKVADRIGFYKRYCDILGVSYGNNIDCYAQSAFPSLNF